VPDSAVRRLSFAHVTKAFDATLALDDVSFDVAKGEVHALLGANGAGKSTLIKILAGLHTPDAGVVLVDGLPVRGEVQFIHQELALVETMSVAEAIAFTRGFARRGGLINWSEVCRDAERTLAVVGATIPVDALVSELSRADRSVVAIARAITDDCKVLVLDEPTASLPDRDVDRLFEILASLKARGVSILYVTHRLDEVYRIADMVTVLRDGRLVKTLPLEEVSRDDLVGMIVGGALPSRVQPHVQGAVHDAVRIEDIELSPDRPRIPSLTIRSGEIVGFAGLRGSGQELLGRGLAGVEPLDFTDLHVSGSRRLRDKRARMWLQRNVGFASSRREQEGLAMTLTIRENLFINPGALGRRPWTWVWPRTERAAARAVASDIQIKPREPESVSGTLSGGNQQKVILGRLLATEALAIVLEEPTMGIDVGARVEIYRLIADAASSGRAVIAVSSDFEELALICHRVLVFDRGVLAAELRGSDITPDAITQHCSGASTSGERVA
jgi:ribose transport system ATP-binding protein